MPDAAHTDTIRRAYRIAVRDLRACYNPEGIVAGRLHFNAYWARDGFRALFGALALGDMEQAGVHLDTFIQQQRPAGELPVRIEFLGHTFGHYHTRRMMPKALYRVGSLFTEPLDPTGLYIIAAREYYMRTPDMPACRRFEPALERAFRWLIAHDQDGDGVIENRYLGDWMDSMLKKDKVFYLNVIFYEALRACETLKRELGQRVDAEQFRVAAERLRARFQDLFWNGEYFTDWVRGSGRAGMPVSRRSITAKCPSPGTRACTYTRSTLWASPGPDPWQSARVGGANRLLGGAVRGTGTETIEIGYRGL